MVMSRFRSVDLGEVLECVPIRLIGCVVYLPSSALRRIDRNPLSFPLPPSRAVIGQRACS